MDLDFFDERELTLCRELRLLFGIFLLIELVDQTQIDAQHIHLPKNFGQHMVNEVLPSFVEHSLFGTRTYEVAHAALVVDNAQTTEVFVTLDSCVYIHLHGNGIISYGGHTFILLIVSHQDLFAETVRHLQENGSVIVERRHVVN